jgi:hypothetical protein
MEPATFWGAQAASLQFAAACREHLTALARSHLESYFNVFSIRPASCRAVQAGSLRSPRTGGPRNNKKI